MTREENTAKLAQLRSETEALVKDYNDAIQNGKFEDASKADKAMTEKINEYTATVRDMCFEDCKNTDNPMLTAVTTLSFVTIGVTQRISPSLHPLFMVVRSKSSD